MGASSIEQRIECIGVDAFKEYEVALTKYAAENAAHLANTRLGIGAGNVAVSVARKALDEMATKYLNDCGYSFTHPADRINQFTAPAKKLLADIKQGYAKGRESAAAFGSQAQYVRLFNESFAEAEHHLDRLTDDVLHGEVGTQILYRHVPGLQRHWNGWMKDLFIAVLGGLVGALAASGHS